VTERHRLVKVPASSANLGPGYDVMAVAHVPHIVLEVLLRGEISVIRKEHDAPLELSKLIVKELVTLI